MKNEKPTKKSYTLKNDLLTKLNFIILSSKYEKRDLRNWELAVYYSWINSHWFYRHLLFPIYLPNKFKNTYFSQNICQILSTASFPLELFLHRAFLLRSYFSMEPLFYRVFLLWNFFTYTSPYQPSSMNNIERTGIKDDKKDGLTPPLNQKFSATPKICLKLCSSSKIVDFTSFF